VAGGPNASVVACHVCFARARRVHEGLEDDHYECEQGHGFAIDWSRSRPARPCWPPSDEERELFEKYLRPRGG
jgi:hypothetical protein